jgi:hypothetical protein
VNIRTGVSFVSDMAGRVLKQRFPQVPCVLHPTSALSGLGYQPDFVIYHECEFILLSFINWRLT